MNRFKKTKNFLFFILILVVLSSNVAVAADTPVDVNAKVDVGENKSVYNFLAPIAGINRMSTISNDPTCTKETGCISNNIGTYLNIIFKLGIGVAAALAVIMLIINGITYMGDESIFKKTEAKSKMFSAIFGLLIALAAWALLNTINPALTGVGGVKISQASVEIENEQVPWSTYEVGDNKTACPSGFVDVQTGANPSKINVCSTIAKNVSDLIASAKTSSPSLIISGSGSRSSATTQALRVKNNCPDPKTPSTQCKPNAVAAPGNSNHEKGLAVDFNCNGVAMGKTDTNNACYVWLTQNASRFGLKNNFTTLQETWHWSVDGK